MSLLQKTYVDYRNLGDKGQDNTSSIQPVVDGEPASMLTFARPSENLRSRTEIARDVFDDLLYYRDRTYRYLIESAGGLALTWEVGGVGRVNNLGALTIRPFITPRTNLKGSLVTGTAAVNQLTYTVQAGAYATDGMNAITIEHRSVVATVTPVVTITAGPIYRILVVYDAANAGHTAVVISGLINTAIAGVPALTGKLATTASGAVSAIAALAETPIDIRSHTGGITGNATADVEAHTLALGALGTFTTTNPLAEGDLLAIRYDYIIEPAGTSDDPKGGVPGGRAESNQSRANSDVSANLFIAQNNPEWLPGCIPLCKVVNGNLHWVDGTVLATGTSGAPGTTLGVFVNSSVFSGLPTVIVNGGIDNSGSIDTLQEALVSVDQRLSQHRFATYVITDGTNSTGGSFNAAGAFTSGFAAITPNGGRLIVRRGNYTTGFGAATYGGSTTIEGENTERGTTHPAAQVLVTQTTTVTVAVSATLRNMAFTRTGSSRVTLSKDVVFENVTWSSGTFTLGNSSNRFVELRSCQMFATNIATDTPAGLILNAERVTATNCWFSGPDLAANNTAVVFQGSNVLQAVYTNCTFQNTTLNVAAFQFADTGNTYGTTFVDCYFRGIATGAFMIDLPTTYTGGDITFYNCRFDNTGGVPVIRTRHSGGRVRFINCTFLCAGSPNGTGSQYQNMLAIAPAPSTNGLALATTSIENCNAFVNCTNFTNMTRAIVEFGCQDTAAGSAVVAPIFGRVRVTDFTLSFSGGTTVLPPTTCMLLCARSVTISAGQPNIGPHVFRNLTVLANQKSTPTTQANVNGNPPYIVQIANPTTGLQRPVVDGLVLAGVVAPQTDNITGGLVIAQRTELRRVQTLVDFSVATTNRYSSTVFYLVDSALVHSDIMLTNWAGNGGLWAESVNVRTSIEDTYLSAPLVSAGSTGALVGLSGTLVRNLRMAPSTVLNTATPSVFRLFAPNVSAANSIMDCDIDQSSSLVPMITASGATSGVRSRISDNRFVTGLTVGGVFMNLGANPPAGVIITGNEFVTNGATAAACIPDMSVISDTTSLVKSNNTFTTSLASSPY